MILGRGGKSNREKLTFPSRKFRRTFVWFSCPAHFRFATLFEFISTASRAGFEQCAFEFTAISPIDVLLFLEFESRSRKLL